MMESIINDIANKKSRDKDPIGQAFGWIGSGLSIIFFLAPAIPTYKLIKKEVKVKEVPGILLTLSLLNCLLWTSYGFKQNKPQMYATNTAGASISLVFIIIFWIYFGNLEPLLAVGYNLVVFALIFLVFGVTYFVLPDSATKGLGTFTMIVNILMYGSTCANIYTVIQKKDEKLIPIWSSVVGIINCGCWLIYGLYINDKNVIIPNALGIAFNVFGTGLYFYIKASKKGKVEDSEDIVKKSDDIPEEKLVE